MNLKLKYKQKLSELSECTFGIYLIHPFVNLIVYVLGGFYLANLFPVVFIPMIIFIVYMTSFVIVFYIRKMQKMMIEIRGEK